MQELLTYTFLEGELTKVLFITRNRTNRLVYASLGKDEQTMLRTAEQDFKKLAARTRRKYVLLKLDSSVENQAIKKLHTDFLCILEESAPVELSFEYLFGTSFEQKVWSELAKVHSGHTTSYGEIAKSIGAPKASRAVGSAVGKNKLALVVPCHRCLPASGEIGNFGWGPDLKKKLFIKERSHAYQRRSLKQK